MIAKGGAIAPELSKYWFVAASGTVTIKGFFIDAEGVRVGDLFSTSVGDTALVGWEDINGDPLPANAVGVIADISGSLKWCLGDSSGAAPAVATVKADGPTLGAGSSIAIGRVG
ncbi:MAG: hypothetical protein R2688_06115 [Fimbriimonadaceae bacterium]